MLSNRLVFLKEIIDDKGLYARVVAYNFITGVYEEFDTPTNILTLPDGYEKRMYN